MKICFIGVQSEVLDEGMINVTTNIEQELSKSHNVMLVNPRRITLSVIEDLKTFNPDIIHYIHGPTIRSFLITKILSLIIKNSKTIMSATHPSVSEKSKYILPKIMPDLMLVQSLTTKKFFKRLGFSTKYLIMSGVDINRFVPVSKRKKLQLRKKYNLKKDDFIILHIGPINATRNLDVLINLQKKVKAQLLIIGSSTVKADNNIIALLEESGCKVWKKYFPLIEELYQLSDIYVFPTSDSYGAIEIPLTILEAMSCNLPVVTFPFGGLPDVFEAKDGLFYVKTDEEVMESIKEIQNKYLKFETRKAVVELSWEKIGKRLIGVYEELIHQKHNKT